MHFCTGTAEAYFTGTQYADLADQLGFIVIVCPFPIPEHERAMLIECHSTRNPQTDLVDAGTSIPTRP
jgi:poly(3-hydroxybutyrate) depolymerase